jgi:hypothetical protein
MNTLNESLPFIPTATIAQEQKIIDEISRRMPLASSAPANKPYRAHTYNLIEAITWFTDNEALYKYF